MRKLLHKTLTIALLVLSTTALAGGTPRNPGSEGTRALAVIVNPKNPVTNLSFNELRAYLKLDKQKWPDGKPVELLLRPSKSVAMEILLDDVYRMTSAQLHKYWAGKVFRGDISSKPSVVPSATAAGKRVLKVPSALTVVMYDQVPADVRVLTIDGKKPTDAGYRLTIDDGEETSRPIR